MHDSDIWGLFVIVAGLVLYRFSGPLIADEDSEDTGRHGDGDLADPFVEVVEAGSTEDGLREPLLLSTANNGEGGSETTQDAEDRRNPGENWYARLRSHISIVFTRGQEAEETRDNSPGGR